MSGGQFTSNEAFEIEGRDHRSSYGGSDGSGGGQVAPLKAENIDDMVRDAEHALGGKRRSPSDDGANSENTEDVKLTSEEAGQATDYRRGQRFKRVAKLLMSEATLRGLKMFKYQAWATALFAIAINVACFVTMYVLLIEQQHKVEILNEIGEYTIMLFWK